MMAVLRSWRPVAATFLMLSVSMVQSQSAVAEAVGSAYAPECPDERGPFPDCPGAGCVGTAEVRRQTAMDLAKSIDLNQPWAKVREDIVGACGLKVSSSTSHCFDDFNHVDCCTMVASNAFNTNADSAIMGMHAVNQLGAHISDGSIDSHGEGGSWCTCQLQTPNDVCHRQFGARPAFKLVWCEGSRVAALMDDDGNVLNHGKPQDFELFHYAERADAWRILMLSKDSAWADKREAACEQVLQWKGYQDTDVTGMGDAPETLSCDSDDEPSRRMLQAAAATEAEWHDAWRQRFACWWIGLPMPTQSQMGACMGALGIHLGSRLDAAWRATQTMMGRTPPPMQSSSAATDANCEFLKQQNYFSMPDFPELPSSMTTPEFRLPPIPRLMPSFQHLQSLERGIPISQLLAIFDSSESEATLAQFAAPAASEPSTHADASTLSNTASLGIGAAAGFLSVGLVAVIARRARTSTKGRPAIRRRDDVKGDKAVAGTSAGATAEMMSM